MSNTTKSAPNRVRVFSISLITGLLLGAGATAASAAQSDTINQTTGYNYTIQYGTARTNTKSPSGTTFKLNSWTPGTGGSIAWGMRRSSGTQFARTDDFFKAGTYPFRSGENGGGSTALSSGTFYLNERITGACGGSGCGDQTVKGVLTWDI